jgi:hypothetical protein
MKKKAENEKECKQPRAVSSALTMESRQKFSNSHNQPSQLNSMYPFIPDSRSSAQGIKFSRHF